MPIYEYACAKCGKAFDWLVRSPRDEREIACPDCGARKATRRPSIFAAHQGRPAAMPLPTGGCGRCGDPNGPCGLD
jgi:putative FmdB family regulatory protein